MEKGAIGLVNLGNTCYLNSVIQCLRHVPDLTVFFHKYLEEWLHKTNDKEVEFAKAYQTLLKDIWSAEPPGYLRPAGFVHYFRDVASKDLQFEHLSVKGQQQDAHEALVFVLDMLHESMTKLLQINIVASEDSPFHCALTAWKEKVAPKYSPIVEYFYGLMQVCVTCQGCKNVSCRYEPFGELILEFPDHKDASLQECMDKQFEGEDIDEYQCEKCSNTPGSKRHPGIIQRKFWRLPQNINIVLKRFNADGSKCTAKFLTDVDQTFTQWFSEKSPEISRTSVYSLHSIVDHHGFTGGGHYVAQVKCPASGKWNVYDDTHVHTMGDGSKPVFGDSNYILFFRRLNS